MVASSVFSARRWTYRSLFLAYMTDDILSSVWEAGDWRYNGGQRTINGGNFDVGLSHPFLAIKVRLQGQHEVPSSASRSNVSLEHA
jgi:hypothetical protein